MGKNTNIQWCDSTVNFWHGCKKVSQGCKNCYMYRDKERYGHDATTVIRSKDKTFYQALQWKDTKRIFTCSWSDFFIEEADAWRNDAWGVIRETPQHTWLILTKRPERIKDNLPQDWGKGWHNVWLGVSIENNNMADLRAPILKDIPSVVKFYSMEPLLEEVKRPEIYPWVQWVIIGGESGNEQGKHQYRECKTEWITTIVNDAKASKATVFVKQYGTYLAKKLTLIDRNGGNIEEFQQNHKYREFPCI